MIIASSVALYIVLNPHYRKPAFRKARTTVFITLGLSGILPISHAIYNNGLMVLKTMGLHWIIISGFLYILGASIYAIRFPECKYPGSFNYFGASHQIFHFFVVGAAICHFIAIRTSFHHFHHDPHFDHCKPLHE